MSEVESFDVLETPTSEVSYNGQRLELKPLTIGKLPAFVRHIKPVFAGLVEVEQRSAAGEDVFELMMDLVAEHGDELQKAASVATGRPLEFIQAGDPVEFLALVKAVIGINRDFFVRRLGQELPQAKPETESPGDGHTASSS